jgi:hypothetical protein
MVYNYMMSKKFVFGFLVLSFLVFAPSVFAQGKRPSPRPTPKMALNEVRLRSCEAKQASIQTRMASLLRMSQSMVKVFDSIAERVQNFYEDKVVPSGKTVPNYDDLVQDVAAKKALVTTALNEAQADSSTFNCSSETDPKEGLNSFRLGMQKVKSALKNYRTSIKNLIVAVKRMGPKESPVPSASPAATGTPLPTATPTVTP